MSGAGPTGPSVGDVATNLFRTEAGRLVAASTRILGLHNLDLAEEIAQETLCHALEVWRFNGLPDNPAAWLVRAAKNRAVDLIRRERTRRRFASDVADLLTTEWTLGATVAQAFMDGEIADEQLRMMFACCGEGLSESASAALILKLLCGFGVREIAAAFLANPDAIERQLSRSKASLRERGELVDVSTAVAVAERLPAVERALYLLFNEGYHGAHPELAVRAELCAEAIRLATLVASHPAGDVPRSHALVATFCLHAARLPARIDATGELVALDDQDRSRWDRSLIDLGLAHMDRAARGDEITALHVEAAIAAAHAAAPSVEATDWCRIRALYDLLMHISGGPIVALNRAIVVARVDGAEAGLAAIDAIVDRQRLDAYPFHHLARADLLLRAGRCEDARAALDTARATARNAAEARFVAKKLAALVSRDAKAT